MTQIQAGVEIPERKIHPVGDERKPTKVPKPFQKPRLTKDAQDGCTIIK